MIDTKKLKILPSSVFVIALAENIFLKKLQFRKGKVKIKTTSSVIKAEKWLIENLTEPLPKNLMEVHPSNSDQIEIDFLLKKAQKKGYHPVLAVVTHSQIDVDLHHNLN